MQQPAATNASPSAPHGREGQNRYGLVQEMSFEDAPGRRYVLQRFEETYLESAEVREAVHEALDRLAQSQMPTQFLEVRGHFAKDSTPQDCWLAWEKVNGPTIADLQRINQIPQIAVERTQWLAPLLERCATVLDEAARDVPDIVPSLALDQVYLDFGTMDFRLDRYKHQELSKWPAFQVRLLPLSLEYLLPETMLPVESRPRRQAWLKRSLPLRYGGMLYHLFNGKTFPEGCPRSEQFEAAVSLTRTAKKVLQACFDNRGDKQIVSSASRLLKEFCSDADASARAPRDRPELAARKAELAPPRPGIANEARAVVPGSTPAVTGPALKFGEGAKGQPQGRPLRLPRPAEETRKKKLLLPTVAAGVILLGGGGYLLFPKSQPQPAPPAVDPAGTPPGLVAADPAMTPVEPPKAEPPPPPTPPAGEMPPTRPEVTPPGSTPPPPKTPREQARELAAAGRKMEAASLLMDLVQPSTPLQEAEALLREAMGYGSAKAARRLADKLREVPNMRDAASLYMEGWKLAGQDAAQADDGAACLQAALALSHGPALQLEGTRLAATAATEQAGVRLLLEAMAALRKGNNTTTPDTAAADKVLDQLKTPALTAALEQVVEAEAAAARGAASAELFVRALAAGSPTAPARLAALVFPATPGSPPTAGIDVSGFLADLPGMGNAPASTPPAVIARELLNLAAARGNAAAMVKLALYYRDNPEFASGNHARDIREHLTLLIKAADLNDRDALFRVGAYYRSSVREQATGQILIPRDMEKFRQLTSRAAQLGHNLARISLNAATQDSPIYDL